MATGIRCDNWHDYHKSVVLELTDGSEVRGCGTLSTVTEKLDRTRRNGDRFCLFHDMAIEADRIKLIRILAEDAEC